MRKCDITAAKNYAVRAKAFEGTKIGRLTFLKWVHKTIYVVQCDCGNKETVQKGNIVNTTKRECVPCSKKKGNYKQVRS